MLLGPRPRSNLQSIRFCAPRCVKKVYTAVKALRRPTQPTLSKSVMVSVVVSLLSSTKLISVKPGVKVDGTYGRNVLDATVSEYASCAAIRQLAG